MKTAQILIISKEGWEYSIMSHIMDLSLQVHVKPKILSIVKQIRQSWLMLLRGITHPSIHHPLHSDILHIAVLPPALMVFFSTDIVQFYHCHQSSPVIFYCTNVHQILLFQCSRISCTGVHQKYLLGYTDVHQWSCISCTDVHQCSSIGCADVYQKY